MNQNDIQVINWDEAYEKQALDLLKQYKETSLFLLSNLKDFGPRMGEVIYSGHFKCLIKNDQVIAVFVLTKIGNVLLQTDRKQDYSDMILNACSDETIPIQGVIGEYSLAKNFWKALQRKFKTAQTHTHTKDILYQLDLTQVETSNAYDSDVRLLTLSDFDEFDSLHIDFMKELHLDQGQTSETRYQNFSTAFNKQHWWGLFQNENLISIGAYNAHIEKMAQIGGIYTIPSMRQKGFSKRLMQQMIRDSIQIHKIEKLILFTQEDNRPARTLYESLGFKQIGEFGLILGEIKQQAEV
jgi:predicted GNAT family acetyltransferase